MLIFFFLPEPFILLYIYFATHAHGNLILNRVNLRHGPRGRCA